VSSGPTGPRPSGRRPHRPTPARTRCLWESRRFGLEARDPQLGVLGDDDQLFVRALVSGALFGRTPARPLCERLARGIRATLQKTEADEPPANVRVAE